MFAAGNTLAAIRSTTRDETETLTMSLMLSVVCQKSTYKQARVRASTRPRHTHIEKCLWLHTYIYIGTYIRM